MRSPLFVILLMILCAPAWAVVVDYAFEGTIDSSSGGNGSVSNIDSFSGRFVYDSSRNAFSHSHDMKCANYNFTYFAVTFNGPGIWLTYPDSSFTRRHVQVRNIASDSSDCISFLADDWTPGRQPLITLRCRIELKDFHKTVFEGDARLPESLNLSDFELRSFTGMDNSWQFQGTITSLTLIPEPTTLLLFGLGALVLRGKTQLLREGLCRPL